MTNKKNWATPTIESFNTKYSESGTKATFITGEGSVPVMIGTMTTIALTANS